MVWTPPDPQVDLTLQRIISRAREEALIGFDEQRQQIERETVRTGFGGTPFHRCTEAASQAIQRFGARIVAELLEIHRNIAGGGTPSPDAIQWIRDIVNEHVDALVDGLGGQIDGLRTTGGIKGARSRIEPAGREAKRDMEIELGKIEIRSRLVHASSAPTPTSSASIEYDVFICHASEDKADVAEPLALALQRRRFRVWLDKYEIRIGDRILTKIDRGLNASRFGVVIISPAFFTKDWSQKELNALAALEASEGSTKILPVWHNVTRAEVQAQSPLLAAVRAANTKDGIEAIADEIAAVLRDAGAGGRAVTS